MKTRTKALLLALCAVLLVVTTVFTTLAFLQDETGTVTNVFTVGKVSIDLYETKPGDEEMTKIETDQTHEYTNVTPGSTVIKDPEVRVENGSQDSWVFVKVDNNTNGLVSYTANTTDWTPLTDANGDGIADDGVYYHDYKATEGAATYDVFAGNIVTISKEAENEANFGTGIQITAYAIQKAAELDTAAVAWAEFTGA